MRTLCLAACAIVVWLAPMPARAQSAPIDAVSLPQPTQSGFAAVNGVRLWYGIYGRGSPVVLVHGGIVGSWVWGKQIPALAAHYRVIAIDNRGHGRSTRTEAPFSYDQMASDILAVLDDLHVRRVALVGWSDGAIVALDVAIHHPERLTKIFVFGGASDTSAAKAGKPSLEDQEYFEQARRKYTAVSPTPEQFVALLKSDNLLDATQPHFTVTQLQSIRVPTWIADGDRDQFVKRENTDFMAQQIPNAEELILPGVDHYAPLEDPAFFNAALLRFLASSPYDDVSGRHEPAAETKEQHALPTAYAAVSHRGDQR